VIQIVAKHSHRLHLPAPTLGRQSDRELGDVGLSKAVARCAGAGAATLAQAEAGVPDQDVWVRHEPVGATHEFLPRVLNRAGSRASKSTVWSGPGAFLHSQ
jgi:hypothetical protein